MRLICPNCGAQYEVDAAAIPDDGREVQCAACGHSWMQFPAPAEAATPAHPDAGTDGDGGETRFERRQRIRREREAANSAPSDGADEDGVAVEPGGGAQVADRVPVKQDVLDILRSEAEHEAEVRRNGNGASGEPAAAPTQAAAEFSSVRDGDEDHSEQARDRAERERHHELKERERRLHISEAESTFHDPEGDAGENHGRSPGLDPAPRRPERPASSRAGLLPDVDHLNATLRPAEERRVSATSRRSRERARERSNGGFRGGFLLAILIGLLLLALYVLAGQLSSAVPGASGLLGAYVEAVDNIRRALDGAMRGLFELVLG